ncbi:MAG: 4Fe-4S ferredoxin [Desulfobacterales bacterium]|nr:MAG: 4Fe-4S ferredoxin [Desulfobacterales bacterium]
MSRLDNLQDNLKKQIGDVLPDLDVVIGWEKGYDAVHATPLFIRAPEDLDRLMLGPLCIHNLATYLPGLKGKKIGVVVKGCDSRAVIELMQEGLIKREDLTIFGVSCDGVVSLQKMKNIIPEFGCISAVETGTDGSIAVTLPSGVQTVPLADVRAEKCDNCRYPDALEYDHFIGEVQNRPDVPAVHPSQEEFETWSDDERFAFWKHEMARCVRCYACRNACPMCVCRDHCIATTRDPQWLSQENSAAENWMFQMIHVMHLTGRCVECGECERACPMDIPLMLLRRRMNQGVREVFDYEAGLDAHATPPLMTFKVEEDHITERDW